MKVAPGARWERLLDPVDRISEILFGLIMAVTIVGSLSIVTAGTTEMRTVTLAALGCNIAWGLVDAVMYLVRTLTERSRNRALAKQIIGADADTAHRLIAFTLPVHVGILVGPAELEGMRLRLLALPIDAQPLLRRRDYLEATAVFLLVVIATFPVVAPFVLSSNAAFALQLSQAIAVVLLLFAGFALARYAGHPRPILPAMAMAVFGVVLVGIVRALGG